MSRLVVLVKELTPNKDPYGNTKSLIEAKI